MEIIFILVEPAVPENVGAAARALKTMGFRYLRMVNPKIVDADKSKTVAHASHEILENAGIYRSFEEAVGDLDLVIASSAKKRRTNENYVSAGDLPAFIRERSSGLKRIGVLFGREESGLKNTEIKKADLVSFIPLYQPYPSLNLAQAVMIYAYLLSGLVESRSGKDQHQPEEGLKALKSKVSGILRDMEMKQLHIIEPRIMERLSYLKNEDINLLHSICNAYLKRSIS